MMYLPRSVLSISLTTPRLLDLASLVAPFRGMEQLAHEAREVEAPTVWNGPFKLIQESNKDNIMNACIRWKVQFVGNNPYFLCDLIWTKEFRSQLGVRSYSDPHRSLLL